LRANRAYELIHARGGLGPAFLAGGQRRDRIELVSIDDGEVVLFWDLEARRAGRLLRQLRPDLARLEAEVFLSKWQEVSSRDDD
jgi:hypothetical protein